jgi:DNA (cytosine-5)-methyltransferase 1
VIHPHEMIVDLFAGGGGASCAILAATGRHPDLAVNHDETAIAVHTANHPTTRHAQASIWKVEPREACAGRAVGLLWASPDCRHFSRASGGAARWKSVRALPGVVITWATRVRPRIICVENVAEMEGWGPLLPNGQPCPDRIGRSFKAWCGRLRGLGYTVEWRQLCAADFGAPTTRTRLFIVARCDGEPITWPQPTHSRRPSMFEAPWRTAAECIDWSIPCPSIFARGKELADKTQARIAHGVRRFVLEAAEPFIVSITHTGGFRGRGMGEPMPTITCANRGEHALIAPVLTKFQQNSVGQPVTEPTHTVMAGAARFGLVAPTLIQVGYGEREGQAPRVPGLDKPLGTVMAGTHHHAVVAAFLAQHNTGVVGHSARRPVSTIMTAGSHQQLVTATLSPAEAEGAERVAAFLLRYNGTNIGQRLDQPLGTATTKERFALVTVAGVPHVITDIGMRMLHWRELAAAQGLPGDYLWTGPDGAPLGKTRIIRLIGNSVSPPPATALLRANLKREPRRMAA